MWTRWKKNISNNTELQNINLDKDTNVVYEINLNRLKDENFLKLKELLRCSPLVKLILRDCFHEPGKLTEILEALVDNVAIKNRSLSLELRDNAFDAACVHEIKKLLSKQILLRLVPPEGLEANSVGEILREILNQNVELTELNIAKSILDPECIELLKQILQNKLIKDKLGMMGCRGVSETCLTTNDKEKLSQAAEKSRRYWPFSGKPNIVWFNYVKHAEASAECNGNYEVCEIEESIRTIFIGKLGKVEKIVRLLVRNKTESEWQLLRSYRKRKPDDRLVSTSSKRIKEEVDINQLAEQMEGNLLKSSDTPTVSSHDITESLKPSFSSSNGTQWTEVRDRTSFSCMPTKSSIIASHHVEESSPRNKAHCLETQEYGGRRQADVDASTATMTTFPPGIQGCSRRHLATEAQGKPSLNQSQHFACNNNHRDKAYENSHTENHSFYRNQPIVGNRTRAEAYKNPLMETDNHSLHQSRPFVSNQNLADVNKNPFTDRSMGVDRPASFFTSTPNPFNSGGDCAAPFAYGGHGTSSTLGLQLNANLSVVSAGAQCGPTLAAHRGYDHQKTSPGDNEVSAEPRRQQPSRRCKFPSLNVNYDGSHGYQNKGIPHEHGNSHGPYSGDTGKKCRSRHGKNRGRFSWKGRQKSQSER